MSYEVSRDGDCYEWLWKNFLEVEVHSKQDHDPSTGSLSRGITLTYKGWYMIAKVLTNYRIVADILDAAFAQTKKECELSSETIADNYEAYAKMTETLETTLRLWRALDDNYDVEDDIVIEIRSRKDSEHE